MMSYRQMQRQLKIYSKVGYAIPKLNSKEDILSAAIDAIETGIVECNPPAGVTPFDSATMLQIFDEKGKQAALDCMAQYGMVGDDKPAIAAEYPMSYREIQAQLKIYKSKGYFVPKLNLPKSELWSFLEGIETGIMESGEIEIERILPEEVTTQSVSDKSTMSKDMEINFLNTRKDASKKTVDDYLKAFKLAQLKAIAARINQETDCDIKGRTKTAIAERLIAWDISIEECQSCLQSA
jgi:hypothetical protein